MAIEVILIDTETGQRQTVAVVEAGDEATIKVVGPLTGKPSPPRCTVHQVEGVLTPALGCPACQGAPTQPDDETIRKALADAMEEHDVASYRAVRYGEAAARHLVQAGRAAREGYARALVPVVRALAGAADTEEPT